ncbi:hypothetical protein AB1Y20_011574 [Prymnesium parvum]|uniref:S1 motif domain-containing protein n=1 Tax=Prymnesium parvum TaxID=97485 RepID=A0AB34IJT1_PRYPA
MQMSARSRTPSALLAGAALLALASPADAAFVGALAGREAVCHRHISMVATTTKAGKITRDERLRSRYSGFAFEPEGGWKDEMASFGYDELAASMVEIASYARGDTVKGTVLGFEPNGAMVDIGVKSSAYVTIQEMALVKPDKPEQGLDLGGAYEFVVISREDENGQLMLSRRRILYAQAWDKVAALYADDAIVEAEVVAVNRGGAMMQVEGLRAFLPGSHFLAGQNPTDEFVGRKLEVKFLDVDKEQSRLVVSHRKAIVDSQINDLSVGSVLKGIITAVKPYGAFVDVGGMSGLLHISQISCDHISDISSVLPVGTSIKCMVISQDKAKGRVALSTKTLEPEAGDMIKNQQKVFEQAEETAAKYQQRIEEERKAREEAAKDVIFGLESVFAESRSEEGETTEAAEPEASASADLEFEG